MLSLLANETNRNQIRRSPLEMSSVNHFTYVYDMYIYLLKETKLRTKHEDIAYVFEISEYLWMSIFFSSSSHKFSFFPRSRELYSVLSFTPSTYLLYLIFFNGSVFFFFKNCLYFRVLLYCINACITEFSREKKVLCVVHRHNIFCNRVSQTAK